MPVNKDKIDAGRSAFKDALEFGRSAMGRESNPDIEFYQSMTDEDFEVLVTQYGMSKTSEYVLAMEELLNKEG